MMAQESVNWLLKRKLKYCNVDGQSGVFTVPCHAVPSRAEPGRAGPGRSVPNCHVSGVRVTK
jgi:hypothetical protein